MAKAILTFFFMEGCGACEQAKPELAAFAKAHEAVIKVEYRDVHRMRWPRNANWRPRFTPSYLVKAADGQLHAYEYPLDQAQLRHWLTLRGVL